MKADQLFKFVRAGALALALTFAFVPSVSNVVLGQESDDQRQGIGQNCQNADALDACFLLSCIDGRLLGHAL